MRKMAWLDKAHGTSLKELNPDFFDDTLYHRSTMDAYELYMEKGVFKF